MSPLALLVAAVVALAAIGTPVAARAQDAAHVMRVLPEGPMVPVNLLRVYVEFAQPMRRGDVNDAVGLIDGGTNEPIEGAFLAIGQEFWSPDMRRLTLFLDPGRIKSGVAPNVEVGAPLREGRTVRLEIDGLHASDGRPILSATLSYRVGPADTEGPDPDGWVLSQPMSQSRMPFVAMLPEPVDLVIARRLVRIEDAAGRPLAGRADWLDARTFRFVPDEPWIAELYRLAVHPALEDHAGNRVMQPFEMASGSVDGGDPRDIRYRDIELHTTDR